MDKNLSKLRDSMTLIKCDKGALKKFAGKKEDDYDEDDGPEEKEMIAMWVPKVEALERESDSSKDKKMIARKAKQLEREFEAWSDRKYPKGRDFFGDQLSEIGLAITERLGGLSSPDDPASQFFGGLYRNPAKHNREAKKLRRGKD